MRRAGDQGRPQSARSLARTRLRESHGRGLWARNITFLPGDANPHEKQQGADTNIMQSLMALVLPHGYPQSVTSDYATFQLWDTIQGLCSYLRGILCQQSLFVGLGVGDSSANVASAALSWMLLSGMSMLGGVLFAFKASTDFGADPKRWRLFADVINDVGLTLSMVAPQTGPFFLPVACLGSICSAICGVAAGATKAAITQHFVKQKSNSALVSDIFAKEGTQETIVSLTGLVLGSLLSSILHGSLTLRWFVFIALTALHVIANYWAVTALCLSTLNLQRASIVIQHYLRFRKVLSPAQVAQRESVWIFIPVRTPAVQFGVPMHSIVNGADALEWLVDEIDTEQESRELLPTYVLHQRQAGRQGDVQVLAHSSCTPIDLLRAFFQASRLLSAGGTAMLARQQTLEQFPMFVDALRAKGWTLDELILPDETWRCEWPDKASA